MNLQVTTLTLKKKKKNKEKITALTAYDFSFATLVDKAGIDVVLVGDSLGMVVLGYKSTVFVKDIEMLHHLKAVTRAVQNAMVICDFPFLASQKDRKSILELAGTFMQEGKAYGVKIEGAEALESIKLLTKASVPVMGHLGLTPQSINKLGGYIVQGKNTLSAKKIIEDAKKLEDAGVFALVLECVPEELAKIVTESIEIPTIGIGAGRYCDGQILVLHDMLGMTKEKPSFVKVYTNCYEIILKAVMTYIDDVKEGRFPSEKNVWHLDEEVLTKLI